METISAADLEPENAFLGNKLDVVPAAPAGRFEIDSISLGDRVVGVDWGDGHHSKFHFIWLRHNCFCAECGSSQDGIRFNLLTDIDPHVTGTVSVDDAGGLCVAWDRDDHESRFDPAWLRSYCYSPEERDRRAGFRPQPWKNELVNDLPTVLAPGPDCSDEARLEIYDLLLRHGFVRLAGVGTDPAETEAIAHLLGPIRETTENGYIYDVRSNPVSQFGAATPMKQHPHTDDPYQYSPPGIDVFHCIRNPPGSGGKSVYVDGFAIAESLRVEEPEAFRLLTTVPLPFVRCHPGRVDFRTNALVIRLDDRDRVVDVRFFDRGVAPLDLPAELVEPMFAAQRAFIERMISPDFQIEFLLPEGDAVILDNSRLMHGRHAFTATSGRHIRLAYIDREEFHARWRDVARRQGRLDHDAVLPH
ncbi:MAG: TauD/TfdA family dioxygenase [Acidimicrobiales bacterium]